MGAGGVGKLSGWGEKRRRRSPQRGEWPETENRKARESKGRGRVVAEREAAGEMGKETSGQDEFLEAWAWG